MVGSWVNDRRQGKGRLRYPDGRIYDGEWKDGDICGEGTLHYANGWTYEGEFLSGFKHGHGIRTEWYGGAGGEEGMRYAVCYTYNTMQEKESLGPCRKEEGEKGMERGGVSQNFPCRKPAGPWVHVQEVRDRQEIE